jgi:chemotaxis protein methyltransferase CheR
LFGSDALSADSTDNHNVRVGSVRPAASGSARRFQLTVRNLFPAAALHAATAAPAVGVPSEFAFDLQDFEFVRTLLKQHTGISLSESKRGMVYSRLARRLRATGQRNFRDYLQALRHGTPEWEQFVNALTTNLTYFYRESHHFDTLATLLRARAKPGTKLRIWCAAASTGEEPWTIALTAAEVFGTLTPPVEILATDLDTGVLVTARKATYNAETVSKVPEALVRRYFTRDAAGDHTVRPELRGLVTFRQQNLLDGNWQAKGPFDAIFCRNVLIYFDRETQLQIVARFAPILAPGGALFVGHSENFAHGQRALRLTGRTVYVRDDA